jgi:hypothetical protein
VMDTSEYIFSIDVNPFGGYLIKTMVGSPPVLAVPAPTRFSFSFNST